MAVARAAARMMSATASTSALVVFHDDTLMRTAVPPCHWVGPSGTISSTRAAHRRVEGVRVGHDPSLRCRARQSATLAGTQLPWKPCGTRGRCTVATGSSLMVEASMITSSLVSVDASCTNVMR